MSPTVGNALVATDSVSDSRRRERSFSCSPLLCAPWSPSKRYATAVEVARRFASQPFAKVRETGSTPRAEFLGLPRGRADPRRTGAAPAGASELDGTFVEGLCGSRPAWPPDDHA